MSDSQSVAHFRFEGSGVRYRQNRELSDASEAGLHAQHHLKQRHKKHVTFTQERAQPIIY